MKAPTFAMGLDFGTASVRALVANVQTGEEIAQAVANYPSGIDGIFTDDKNDLVARQLPGDWLNAMTRAVKNALRLAGKNKDFRPENIIGIGIDATGSTPLPLDREGMPLAMRPRFARDLNAMAWLWKDHSSVAEAEEITARARASRPQYLAPIGGVYSSEWFWAKILHCLRVAPKVYDAAFTWAECSDYLPAALTATANPSLMKRNVCAAGHKGMYSENWGGLPDKIFLSELDPKLAPLRDRLFEKAVTSDQPAGKLTREWARRLGLPERVTVAVGAIDAHLGAVGAGIRPGILVKIIGTSTCDMMVAPARKPLPDIPGVSGIVKGSIIPDMYGLEAGQAAVGDIFNWFVNELAPQKLSHPELTKKAEKLRPGQTGLLALDWNNGNRNVLVDHRLSGLLIGQTLATSAHEVYRALIEATAFGARMIMDRVEEYGVEVKQVVNCGGISEKNNLLLQIYADALARPMKIARSAQTVAMGAAMMAAVAAGPKAGGHPSVRAAQKAMSGLKPHSFQPRKQEREVYNELFELYKQLHDSFGGVNKNADLGMVMKKLLAIKERRKN